MYNEERGYLPSLKNQKVIECECGVEILLFPDVKEMDCAIAKHAESHSRNAKTPEKAKAIFEHIQDYLVKQVLAAASQ